MTEIKCESFLKDSSAEARLWAKQRCAEYRRRTEENEDIEQELTNSLKASGLGSCKSKS